MGSMPRDFNFTFGRRNSGPGRLERAYQGQITWPTERLATNSRDSPGSFFEIRNTFIHVAEETEADWITKSDSPCNFRGVANMIRRNRRLSSGGTGALPALGESGGTPNNRAASKEARA